MDINWSPAQLEALKKSNKNRMVSAGAGSGKTQVLSQKVNDLLQSKDAEPESILVVTFTVAAAFNMKKRIKKNLKANGFPQETIDKINSSHIETFDAFAQFLVKKYAQILNISENLSIIDEQILSVKINEYLDEILDELYKNNDQDFIDLVKDTCYKTDDDLKDIILYIYDDINKEVNKEYILNHYDEIYYDEEKIKNDYYDFLKLHKDRIKDYFIRIFYKNFFENTQYADDYYELLKENLLDKPIEDFYVDIKSFKKLRSKKYELSENDEDSRELFSKAFDKSKEAVSKYGSLETNLRSVTNCKKDVHTIIKIIKKLDIKVSNYKRITNTYTFDDVFFMALSLLENHEDIRQKVKNNFKFILIDEYQDTSDIQEKFINLIENNNLYMVGDVKQSIYRFRNANCDIFSQKYEAYKKDPKKGDKVDLIDNFRSRSQILYTVNDIFRNTMTNEFGGANYKTDHIISFGLKSYEKPELKFPGADYGINQLRYKKGNSKDKEIEFRIIANKIIELINQGFKVYDKNDDGIEILRDVRFSDFAILMRAKKEFPKIKEIFNSYNIPIACDLKNSYTDFDSLLLMNSIIRGIDFYRHENCDDVIIRQAFASIARSYAFEYSDEKIYDLLKDDSYLEDEIIEKLSRIAAFSKENSVESTTRKFIDEFHIVEKIYKLDEVEDNLNKIEYFYNKAQSFDVSKLSFDDFAAFFEKLKKYKQEFEIESADTTTNAVKLLTIHGSKGLEYPVVFLPRISKLRAVSDTKKTGFFDKQCGIFFKTMDEEQSSNFYKPLYSFRERYETGSEELRIFYVALTRAREIVYTLIDVEDEANGASPMYDNHSYLNFILNSGVELKSVECTDIPNRLNKENSIIEISNDVPELTTFKYDFKIKKHKQASHGVDESLLDDELTSKLDYGIKMHEFMELIDFKNKDTSFIKDLSIKRKIDKVLTLDLLNKPNLIDAYKEYEFFDEENGVHGFIDLFLLYEDHIDIIDYKLKNIDKLEYVDQLRVYKDFVEKTFKKRCRTYLISLVDGIYEEIVHEE